MEAVTAKIRKKRVEKGRQMLDGAGGAVILDERVLKSGEIVWEVRLLKNLDNFHPRVF